MKNVALLYIQSFRAGQGAEGGCVFHCDNCIQSDMASEQRREERMQDTETVTALCLRKISICPLQCRNQFSGDEHKNGVYSYCDNEIT